MEPTVQQSGLPAPSGAPDAPAPAAPTAPPVAAKPADVAGTRGSDSPSSPVSAAAAASNEAQLAAAAPVEPVAEEAPAPAELSLGEPSTKVQDKQVFQTGNDSFDQVAALLDSKGVPGYSDILVEAASGDLSLASKAALVDSLGAEVAGLVTKQLESEIASQRESGNAEAARLQDFVAESLGMEKGDAAWTGLRDFVLSEASGYTDADRTALNDMLAAGGVKAEWAIKEAIATFQKSQGFTQVPNLLSGDGPTQAGFQPLSKQDYVSEMRTAQSQFGEGSREVEALRNRRAASMQRGF